MKTVVTEKCHICGELAQFDISDDATLLRDATCRGCGCSLRNSDVAGVFVSSLLGRPGCLRDVRDKLKELEILNTCSSGMIHHALYTLPNYICSEFFEDVPNGEKKSGIYSIDLMNIPFGNNTFDVIITEDIFEHVENCSLAFSEIWRVLKPGGVHLFTVPVHEGKRTKSRIGNPKKVFHGDPLRESGAPVVTDFGDDLPELLHRYGFQTRVHREHIFFMSNEITDVDSSYEDYLLNTTSMEKYFRYNSIVFEARKVLSHRNGWIHRIFKKLYTRSTSSG